MARRRRVNAGYNYRPAGSGAAASGEQFALKANGTISGTDVFTDSGNYLIIDPSTPVSTPGTLSAMETFLYYDTGVTAVERPICTLYIKAQSYPSGNAAIILTCGFVVCATTPTFGTDVSKQMALTLAPSTSADNVLHHYRTTNESPEGLYSFNGFTTTQFKTLISEYRNGSPTYMITTDAATTSARGTSGATTHSEGDTGKVFFFIAVDRRSTAGNESSATMEIKYGCNPTVAL